MVVSRHVDVLRRSCRAVSPAPTYFSEGNSCLRKEGLPLASPLEKMDVTVGELGQQEREAADYTLRISNAHELNFTPKAEGLTILEVQCVCSCTSS